MSGDAGLEEERARVGPAYRVYRSDSKQRHKGIFRYCKDGAAATYTRPPMCDTYAQRDEFEGLYCAPQFFRGAHEDYITVVEELCEDPRSPGVMALLAKLRAEVPGDASALANSRILLYQKRQHEGSSATQKRIAAKAVGVWQREFKAAELHRQYVATAEEQASVGRAWRVDYDASERGVDYFLYTCVATGNVQSTRPPVMTCVERYIMAVEDSAPTLERNEELDYARDAMPIRECIDLARSNRDTMGWEAELKFLYHKVVVEQGTSYTADSCQLVAATRRAYGLDLAITACSDRICRFDDHWKGELYLALLLKHRQGPLVNQARDNVPYATAQSLCAAAEYLDMQRTIGDKVWHGELRRLQAIAPDSETVLAPQQRKRVRTGAGALPFISTGRALVSEVAARRPVPRHEQVPDAGGYVPYRTEAVIMTNIGPRECVLEAVRFALGSNRYARASFGLPLTGDVNMKALVHAANSSRLVPFRFRKQPPVTWEMLPKLPQGIYIARAAVGEWSHMVVYDTWRHLLFLGGTRAPPEDTLAPYLDPDYTPPTDVPADRGWFVEDEEVAHPEKFAAFMHGLLDGLQPRLDTIYRVDVHAKKLEATHYA